MEDTIISSIWQSYLLYSINDNAPFFHGNLVFIIDGELIFGGWCSRIWHFYDALLSIYLKLVLAIDGRFAVIPRVSADTEQLVTIHAVLDNVISDL